MNLFDIVIISTFVGSSFLGLYRGFIFTFIDILRVILIVLLLIFIFPLTMEIIEEHVSMKVLVYIISFAVSYILSSFASSWISNRLKEIFDKYRSGIIDKISGLWLGAVKGFFIAIIVFMSIGIVTSSSYVGAKDYMQILSNIDAKQHPKWLRHSRLYSFLNYSQSSLNSYIENSFVGSILKSKEIIREERHEIINQEIPTKSDISDQLLIEEIQEDLTQI